MPARAPLDPAGCRPARPPPTDLLHTHGAGDAGDDEEDAYDEEEEEEDDALFGGEEEGEEAGIEADEGNELVEADDEPDMLYQMLEDDPEMTMEAVAAFEAAGDADVDLVVDTSAAMPAGSVGDVVSGTVRGWGVGWGAG